MYYNARYYDPAIGQFISPDTIVPDPSNVLDYNRYMYVRGNPVNANDPSGHCEQSTYEDVDIDCWQALQNLMQFNDEAYAKIGYRPYSYVEASQWNTEQINKILDSWKGVDIEALDPDAYFSGIHAGADVSLANSITGNASIHAELLEHDETGEIGLAVFFSLSGKFSSLPAKEIFAEIKKNPKRIFGLIKADATVCFCGGEVTDLVSNQAYMVSQSGTISEAGFLGGVTHGNYDTTSHDHPFSVNYGGVRIGKPTLSIGSSTRSPLVYLPIR